MRNINLKTCLFLVLVMFVCPFSVGAVCDLSNGTNDNPDIPVGTTSFDVSTWTGGQWDVFVTAFDDVGNESSESNVVTVDVDGLGHSLVTWDANTEPDLAGYRIYWCVFMPDTTPPAAPANLQVQ